MCALNRCTCSSITGSIQQSIVVSCGLALKDRKYLSCMFRYIIKYILASNVLWMFPVSCFQPKSHQFAWKHEKHIRRKRGTLLHVPFASFYVSLILRNRNYDTTSFNMLKLQRDEKLSEKKSLRKPYYWWLLKKLNILEICRTKRLRFPFSIGCSWCGSFFFCNGFGVWSVRKLENLSVNIYCLIQSLATSKLVAYECGKLILYNKMALNCPWRIIVHFTC